MLDKELSEKLNDLIKMSKLDDKFHIIARQTLWKEITKDICDRLSHFIHVCTNNFIDKTLISKDSKSDLANLILSDICGRVMDNVAPSYKEDFSNPLEADHIGINSEFFE